MRDYPAAVRAAAGGGVLSSSYAYNNNVVRLEFPGIPDEEITFRFLFESTTNLVNDSEEWTVDTDITVANGIHKGKTFKNKLRNPSIDISPNTLIRIASE